MNIFYILYNKLFGQQIFKEALEAYFYKLPNIINVEWFRDDGFIIGKIHSDGKVIMTQGKDADDFIEMVNSAIQTAYDIPKNYYKTLKNIKAYSPPSNEKNKLEDITIKKSHLLLYRKQQFKTA